jgi:hypothetical protein
MPAYIYKGESMHNKTYGKSPNLIFKLSEKSLYLENGSVSKKIYSRHEVFTYLKILRFFNSPRPLSLAKQTFVSSMERNILNDLKDKKFITPIPPQESSVLRAFSFISSQFAV